MVCRCGDNDSFGREENNKTAENPVLLLLSSMPTSSSSVHRSKLNLETIGSACRLDRTTAAEQMSKEMEDDYCYAEMKRRSLSGKRAETYSSLSPQMPRTIY
jgi:hypothetical protein